MDSHFSARSSLAWNGDVHKSPLGKELPERGGTGVAEYGIGAAGEYSCHPPALLAEPQVPDGVNTAMYAVQAPCVHAAPPGSVVDTSVLELCYRDHAVLVSRNPGNEGVRIGVGEFSSHVGR
jgi:hypothetical protein